MCTVSFIYKGNQEFVLTSNRDETSMRVANLPDVYDVLGVEMIYPKDIVAGGTWFEIHPLPAKAFSYRIRRIAPYGNIDVDGVFKVNDPTFDIQKPYKFIHNSNCLYCNIEQGDKIYYFSFEKDYLLALE